MTRTVTYIIQGRPKNSVNRRWVDIQPFEDGTSGSHRQAVLTAYRERSPSSDWRLVRRTVTEEEIPV